MECNTSAFMTDGREIFGQWTTPEFFPYNNGSLRITYNH